MSAKNKSWNKKNRKAERAAGDTSWSEFARTPLSGFPRAGAIEVLARPFPAKMVARRRKRMMKALSFAIEVPRLGKTDPAVKMLRKLQHSTLSTLIRRIKQFARRAATCKYLLEMLSADSQFRPALAQSQTANLSAMQQARAEYTVRTQPAI